MSFSIVDLPWLPPPPADWTSLCKVIGATDPTWVGASIKRLAEYSLDARQSLALGRALQRGVKAGSDLAPLTPVRLGILASNTVDLLVDCLPAAGARHGIALQVVTTPYDQVMQQALDPASAIHTMHPDAILLALDHRWFGLQSPDFTRPSGDIVAAAITRLSDVVGLLKAQRDVTVILQTVPIPSGALFGSYDRSVRGTLRGLIEHLNQAIVALAGETSSNFLDTASLAETIGTDRWFDPVQWAAYKLPFSADCGPIYADHLGRLLGAIRGKSRKCLVLDLDNTLWGGVIGDDGLEGIKLGEGSAKGEAFLTVQRAALDLRNRGIFLAVCSKNDDGVARQPFREHPEMLLKETHVSVFQANWLDKPSNLEAIAKSLNIGIDSLVFLDDNPAERAQVRAALPMVAVPELPKDPCWYAWTLAAAGYFEAVNFSAEDRHRAETVAADARREEVFSKARNLGHYLSSLEMVISFAPFDKVGRQRITQLINKTNQFNLTTRRYTEAEVISAEENPANLTLQVRLRDRFGELGMIGVVICRSDETDRHTWSIDTWLMSCRVLGRDVERAVLEQIVSEAKTRGTARLLGHYIPTPKNDMVAEHYKRLGFDLVEKDDDGRTLWLLRTADHQPATLPMKVEVGALVGA